MTDLTDPRNALENIIYSYTGTLMYGSPEQREEAMASILAVADGIAKAERESCAQLAEQHRAHIWTRRIEPDGESSMSETPFADLIRARSQP